MNTTTMTTPTIGVRSGFGLRCCRRDSAKFGSQMKLKIVSIGSKRRLRHSLSEFKYDRNLPTFGGRAANNEAKKVNRSRYPSVRFLSGCTRVRADALDTGGIANRFRKICPHFGRS